MIQMTFTDAEINVLEYERYHHPVPFQISAEIIGGPSPQRLALVQGTLQPSQVTSKTVAYQALTSPRTLLVNDRAGAMVVSYYTTALSSLSRSADAWDVAQQGLPKVSDLYNYDMVIWATGASQQFASDQLGILQAYQNLGGHLLLTGQDVDVAAAGASALFASALYTEVDTPSVTSTTIAGEDILAGVSITLNGSGSANNQVSPGAFTLLTGSVALSRYQNGTGINKVAALRHASDQGKLIYLGFGLEGISTATNRTTVLQRLLNWLEETATSSFPFNAVLDTFNRANGAVGSNWTGATSVFAIQSNTLATTQSAGSTNRMVWTTSFGSNQEVYAKIASLPSAASEINLVLKEANRGNGRNLLEVWYQPQRGTVQVWTVHNYGTWNKHGADIPITFAAGDQIGARAKADGTVEVYKNGVLVGSVMVASTWPHRAEGGRVGVWLVDASTTTYDDFGGGTLP